MPLSVRLRFEVFKRDSFTCQYCGRTSPAVILEADHIVPRSDGGSDDLINLTTSCWDCNRGKSNVPLGEVRTGEDPHDRAVEMLERERQLREYNEVLARVYARVDVDTEMLVDFWEIETRRTLYGSDLMSLRRALAVFPAETIKQAMRFAVANRKTQGLGYVHACLNNWLADGKVVTVTA